MTNDAESPLECGVAPIMFPSIVNSAHLATSRVSYVVKRNKKKQPTSLDQAHARIKTAWEHFVEVREAEKEVHVVLKDVLQKETEQLLDFAKNLYETGIGLHKKLVSGVFEKANVKELDTSALWDKEVLDGQAFLEVANHEAAKALKSAWAPLAQDGNILYDVADIFTGDVGAIFRKLFEQVQGAYDYGTCEDQHNFVKSKICEFIGVRALYKTISPDTKIERDKAKSGANVLIKKIGGTLDARFALLLKVEEKTK